MALRFYDGFCGIGGFHLGIKNAFPDAICVGACEIDRNCVDLYNKNFGIIPDGDIRQVDPRKMNDFDLYVSGFPCQAFSMTGKLKGLNDETNGDFIFHIANILKAKRPRWFLLENVANLLKHDRGKSYETIKYLLADIGYTVREKIIEPWMYGVPQFRKRVFIVGDIDGFSDFTWPNPTHSITDNHIDTILEPYPPSYTQLKEPFTTYMSAWGGYIGNLNNVPHHIHAPTSEIANFPKIHRDFYWHATGNDISNTVIYDGSKGLYAYDPYCCRTLKRSGSHQIIYGQRTLSIIEMARLQSMESLKYMPPSQHKARKMFGNAVSTLCVSKIVENLVR